MYKNLRIEMVRCDISVGDVAHALSVRYATACDKLNGKYRFYYDEAFKIKKRFFPDFELEYLFSTWEVERNEKVC